MMADFFFAKMIRQVNLPIEKIIFRFSFSAHHTSSRPF
jgi:hypothetical protein